MSYLALEQSQYSGQPVELYRFVYGPKRWLYTSGQQAIQYQAETYKPATITRGPFELSQEIQRSSVEIRVARDLPIAVLFFSSSPEGVVSVTIYRTHLTDQDGEVIAIWKGRVIGASASGSEVLLKCDPIASSLQRPGLRAYYQVLCRHALYSAECGALKDSYRVDGVVSAVSGSSVTVPDAATKPDGYFTGGMMSTGSGARMITGHTGSAITLAGPLIGLQAGVQVSLYAGCDHTMATCRDKFANLDNFGGFPFIPLKNPFTGDAIV